MLDKGVVNAAKIFDDFVRLNENHQAWVIDAQRTVSSGVGLGAEVNKIIFDSRGLNDDDQKVLFSVERKFVKVMKRYMAALSLVDDMENK